MLCTAAGCMPAWSTRAVGTSSFRASTTLSEVPAPGPRPWRGEAPEEDPSGGSRGASGRAVETARGSENNGRADTAGTSNSASAPVSPRTTGRCRGTSGKHDRKAGSAAARKNPRSRLARVALLVAWFVLSTAVAAGYGVLGDGAGEVQRDLYSAFLPRFVVENTLDARSAVLAFPGAKPLLRRAASERTARTCERGGACVPPRTPVRQSGSPVEES